MDRSSTLYRLPIIWDSDSDTEDSSVDKQTEATRLDQEQTTPDLPAIEDLLRNCQKYKDELQMGENLKGAVEEYKTLLKKAKEIDCKQQTDNPPTPKELRSVTYKKRKQAPSLYAVIDYVSKSFPDYRRWREAVAEFIMLATVSQSEQKSSQKKRSDFKSGYKTKNKPLPKLYKNNIEKLLDQDWGPDRAPGPSVLNDYRHLLTCESSLRSTFPEADIFGLVDATIWGPEDVPSEFRQKTLFHFMLSINPKEYEVEPSDAWRDFGRLVLAEKQLELAKKAQGPDLHKNFIIKKQDFYKMLREKEEMIEELSTRLSKLASQQRIFEYPNIEDLSDTHRPTKLGEMYSQLYDYEWSDAYEAFIGSTMAKEGDDDDDMYPNIMSILWTLFTEALSFCREKSCEQLQDLENKIKEALKQNTADTPQIFLKERLPQVLQDDKIRQDQRVISYVKKCVELCWFMNVLDPPMELLAPKVGDDVDKNLFRFYGRKGKKVQTCVWAALLLHKEGPVVVKGHVLPKPK